MTDQTEAPKPLWKDSYELGLPVIDGQHRKLVEYLDNLNRAIHAGRPNHEVVQCVHFLQQYTDEHFHSEEKFLADRRVPGLEDHKRLHQAFRSNVDRVKQAVETNLAMDQSVQLIRSILVHWILEHITGTDKLYAFYLRAGGEMKR